MPALPADAAAASARGPATAIAFALEAARRAMQHGAAPDAALGMLFVRALAALIGAALRPAGGDPAYQALVLRTRDAEVDEHVWLAEQAEADRRTVLAGVDAIAHPGKLRSVAPGPQRDALAELHRLASAGAWAALRAAAAQLIAQPSADGKLHATLGLLLQQPALARLERGTALHSLPAVARYRSLCALSGPAAGSEAAHAKGTAAAQRGHRAEAGAMQALQRIAETLQRRAPAAARYRVAGNLLVPAGFPGSASKAKNEWDAALLRTADAGADAPAEIALLVEVKASPEAAVSDVARLVAGLQRLAHAQAEASYAFASADGPVRLLGASLRALRPVGEALPPQVIYCCSAPAEPQVPMLSAASRGVLLSERASLAFAAALAAGEAPDPQRLGPVWQELGSAARLRGVLHQYDTARTVREAMLHPDDLLAAL